MPETLPAPLALCKLLRIPLVEVAVELQVSSRRMQMLCVSPKPAHRLRVLIAEMTVVQRWVSWLAAPEDTLARLCPGDARDFSRFCARVMDLVGRG